MTGANLGISLFKYYDLANLATPSSRKKIFSDEIANFKLQLIVLYFPIDDVTIFYNI